MNDYGVVTQSFWMVWAPFRPHSSPVSALVSSSGRREDAAYLIPSSIVRQFFNVLSQLSEDMQPADVRLTAVGPQDHGQRRASTCRSLEWDARCAASA